MSSLHLQHQWVVIGDMLSAKQERILLGPFHSGEMKQNMAFLEECKEFSSL